MIGYSIIVEIFLFFIRLAALFSPKLRKELRTRDGVLKQARQVSRDEKKIWFHCASLGEFEQARELIERVKRSLPDYKIIITFFSSSGYTVQKDYPLADHVFYLPFDIHRHIDKFVEIIHPEIIIIVKYEFWLNFMTSAKKQNIQLAFISTTFKREDIFFKWYGSLFRKVLGKSDKIFVQDRKSELFLKSIGITQTEIAGDTRFDRVERIVSENRRFPEIDRFTNGVKTFIVGSSWPRDERIAMKLIREYPIKFILAPHKIEEKRIVAFTAEAESLGKKVVRYSAIDTTTALEQADILIIDCIGILAQVYRYGFAAMIGGGFGAGIHNTLEAAAFGLPIIFGPNYHRFKEAVDLIEQGVAQSVADGEAAVRWLGTLLNDQDHYKAVSTKCSRYVEQQTGACDKILRWVEDTVAERNAAQNHARKRE